MLKFNKLKGFALFETAISLIVASSFVVSYGSQQTDKQVIDDVLNYSKSSQLAVLDYYQQNGILPTNNKEAKLPSASKVDHPSISTLEIGEFGEITITLSDNKDTLSEKTIILEPRIINNNLTWTCNNGSLENFYRPTSCYKDNNNTDEYIEIDEEENMLEFMDEANYI